MLAKYNLHVGNEVTAFELGVPTLNILENPTGIQSSSAKSLEVDLEYAPINLPWIGTAVFSNKNY